MISQPSSSGEKGEGVELLPCPFCGGPACKPILYNGAMETGCGGDHSCPGTDVLVPLKLWNIRAASWQPIESAPKDGTPIILLTADGPHEGLWGQGYEGDHEVSPIEPAWCCPALGSYDDAKLLPTHWLPLPPLPEGGLK